MNVNQIYCGDSLAILSHIDQCSIQTCVTSPPYFGLRDYGFDEQIGLEKTPEEYIEKLVEVFREVKRVLKDDGTLWLNIGDSYAGSGKGWNTKAATLQQDASQVHESISRFTSDTCKPKDLIGIPWMLAFALRSDGWYLRQDIIWSKPNPMPESVTDRCTRSHEYIFLLAKKKEYFYDNEAIKERATYSDCGRESAKQGDFSGKRSHAHSDFKHISDSFRAIRETRNKRDVWNVPTKPFRGAHFATFPDDLIKPCILASARIGDTVIDPFGGSGTTGKVAYELGRNFILIEGNPDYCKIAEERLAPILAQARLAI